MGAVMGAAACKISAGQRESLRIAGADPVN